MTGYPEMIVILVIVLFLFGPDKLPEIARSIGKSVKEFKKAQMTASEEQKTVEKPTEDSDAKIHKLATEMGIDKIELRSGKASKLILGANQKYEALAFQHFSL